MKANACQKKSQEIQKLKPNFSKSTLSANVLVLRIELPLSLRSIKLAYKGTQPGRTGQTWKIKNHFLWIKIPQENP